MLSKLRFLLPPYINGSHSIFGFDIYGERSKKTWFKYSILPIYHFVKSIDNGYRWIIDRTVTKHHIVKTDLKPGWCDVDEVMFRACFALLGRFVENELGTEPWSDDPDSLYRGYRLHSSDGNDEAAIDLWLWYKEQLPQEEKAYRDYIHAKYDGENVLQFCERDPVTGLHEVKIIPNKVEKEYSYDYVEDIKSLKLQELIDMRRSLWT